MATSAARPVLAALLLAALLGAGCILPGGVPPRSSWAYEATGLAALAGSGLDGSGVRVAVLDTGLDAGHRVFDGLDLVAWADVAEGSEEPVDHDGHGTYVASLLAGGRPLRGAAPKVELIAVKVFDREGRASDLAVAEGVRFAVAQGADVIGMSLGGDRFPLLGTATEDAVRVAVAAGVLVVAAAGNEGPDNADVRSPASVQGAIAVAAVGRDLRVADFSSRGAAGGGGLIGLGPRTAPDQKPEVSAPGVGINGAWRGGKYASADGTSAAVPFVAGALALVLQAHPGQDPRDGTGAEEWKEWLMETASPVPGAQRPHDRAAGYGLLDAQALVRRAGSS